MEISEIQVDGYEKVVRCRDESCGLHAIIAVHDTTLGPALGGMRLLPYESEDEALFDVLRLSKGMTYKSAVAQTGLGGGKSVLIGDTSIKSPELFRTMGRFVESLGGLYITAEDMNIGIPDLEYVREETRWVTGLTRDAGSSGNPSPYTARGCLQGMRALLERVSGSGDFSGRRVLVAGVGAVGGRLAVLLKEAGAHVIISDINEQRVRELSRDYGFEVVASEGHHRVECDIYAPCATGACLNDRTIPELRARAVGGSANNQLLEPRHADELHARGILYAPDYVINAGGIINVSVELLPGGYDETEALRRIDRIYDICKELLDISEREGITPRDAAARLAEERLLHGRTAQA